MSELPITDKTRKGTDMQQPLPASQDNERQRQEQILRNQAVIDLLNLWDQEDPEEQRETLEYLMHALDQDRPSARKLFP
jgi:hypothetical protein